MKRAIILILALLSVAPLPSAAIAGEGAGAPPTRLTLDAALRRALEVNNQVEQSRREVQAAEANRGYLLSQVMPHIAINGNLQRNSIERTFGEGANAVTILPANNWNYSITLQQPLFAGLREQRAYSQAKLGVENAVQDTRETEDQTLLRVASSFLGLVNADARMDVERKNIELAENRRKQAQAFYEAGEVTKVDVLRAETAIQASQRALAAAQQARDTAESDLRAALDLDGPIEAVPQKQQLPPVPDEATLVAHAEARRPDVQVASNNVRIASLEVAKQRGFWLPTLAFNGGLINQKSAFPAQNYTFGALQFSIPVFQSGEVQNRVAGAKAREYEARVGLDTMKVTAREDVRKALAARRAAATSLVLAREQLAAAEAEYAQTFELYRAQEATSLDLSTSEASLADARRAVAEETLNHDLAELRVWFAAGDIKQAVGVQNQ
ncbi:MAG TPA: TolC family protein [Thermoanaerobaculia bacterium]|nr:TolC family protein [Thermoanaerobaculia bacterium]